MTNKAFTSKNGDFLLFEDAIYMKSDVVFKLVASLTRNGYVTNDFPTIELSDSEKEALSNFNTKSKAVYFHESNRS